MKAEEIEKFEETIRMELRTFGVVLYDDVGNRIKPESSEERRIVSHIARNVAQLVVVERELTNNDLMKLRRAVEKVCVDTDWCPVCEHHPSRGHHKTCVLETTCQTSVRESAS